jgi:broad specificity phosphatase PhoE
MAGEWLRENLTTEPILFSSPFTRAVQTAEILGLGVEIHLDDRLREREWGDYPLDQYGADRYMADLARCHIPDWKSEFPGSESIEDLVPSSRDFYRDSTETAGGRPVVAVTHGGRILALEIAVEGEITNRRLANCCILHYRIGSEGGAVRILYPAQPHLQPTDWTPIPNILSA